MKKQKTKGSQISKSSGIITEEDRNTNPIFKTIYKRIRNLNKKLGHIQNLQQQDPATMNPEQLQKLASKSSVQDQIAKNEEFALFYKNILVESGGVNYDISEEIMKIATLLAVGAHMNTHKYSNAPNHLKSAFQNYKQATNITWPRGQAISEVIPNIFTTLTEFLGKSSEYSACKDYISEVSELEESKNEPELCQNVGRQQQERSVQVLQKIEKRQEQKLLEDESNPSKLVKNEEVSEKASELQLNSEQKIPDSSEKDKVVEKKQEKQGVEQSNNNHAAKSNIHPKNNRTQNNKDRNQNHRQRNNYKGNKNHRQNNNNHRQNNNNHRQNNNRYKNNNHYYQKRNQNNTKKPYKKRKGSDTSLESTPQKLRPQKPKYIQKQ